MDVRCFAGHFLLFNSNKASRSVLESDIDFALKPHLRWKIRWNQDWLVRRRWRVKLEASIALLQTSLFVLFETWIAIHKFKIDSFYVLHGFKNILFVLTFFNFGQSSLQVFSVSLPCVLVVIDEFFSSNLSLNFTLTFSCYTLFLHFLWVYLCIPGPQLNMLFLPFVLVCELDFLGHHRLHPHAHNTKLEVVSCILPQTTDRRVVIICPTGQRT